MEVLLRAARPDDVEAAVPLIYSSGPAAFDFIFKHATKGSAQDFLRHAFVQGTGEFGYQNHLVASIDDEVAGIGCLFSGRDMLGFTLVAARQILSFYGLAGIGVMIRGLRVEQVIRPPKGDEQYIAHLGVKPEMRGRGIGAQLVNHFCEQVQAAGFGEVMLDVAISNPRAQALYERLGFVVAAERESNLQNEFATVVNHRVMKKSLAR